jgi:hypothetical protein
MRKGRSRFYCLKSTPSLSQTSTNLSINSNDKQPHLMILARIAHSHRLVRARSLSASIASPELRAFSCSKGSICKNREHPQRDHRSPQARNNTHHVVAAGESNETSEFHSVLYELEERFAQRSVPADPASRQNDKKKKKEKQSDKKHLPNRATATAVVVVDLVEIDQALSTLVRATRDFTTSILSLTPDDRGPRTPARPLRHLRNQGRTRHRMRRATAAISHMHMDS